MSAWGSKITLADRLRAQAATEEKKAEPKTPAVSDPKHYVS